MNNTVAKIILIIGAIIIACLIGGILIYTVLSRQEIGQESIRDVSATTNNFDESFYGQFDGSVVNGSSVLTAIKQAENSHLSVLVNNGKNTVAYFYGLTSYDASKMTGVLGSYKGGFSGSKMAEYVSSKIQNGYYIDPSGFFVGGLIRDQNNGAVIGILFCKQGVSMNGQITEYN